MSYIPDVAKLAEYIDYKNNYQSVTTPLTIIGVLEEIDLKKNTDILMLELNNICNKKEAFTLISHLAINDFIFNFKVLNEIYVNPYTIYYKALKNIGLSIKYDEFIFYFEQEKKKLTMQKFINKLMSIEDIQALTIDYVDLLSGHEFEKLCALIFTKMNYLVKQTKATHDHGADLIISKNQVFYAVQCKKYSSTLSNTAIQEVVASMNIYNCSKSMVITNSVFAKSAINLAKSNDVLLIDRIRLTCLISNIETNDYFNTVSAAL